ncbi:MAG: SUMF1/EgtB/PvdO family nonheme iron enzyme [Caldilineaceae bacterium]
MLYEQRAHLRRLQPAELELLLRSALAAGYEVAYWFKRTQEGAIDRDAIVLAGLASENWRTRAGAVAALGQLGDRYSAQIIARLADDYPQVRIAAIHTLERVQPDGAWRQHLQYECYVPAGSFIMGDDEGESDQKPAHAVYLDAYYIGKYPVTNADYQRYMADRGRTFSFAAGREDHPAVYISWFDAAEYAEWAGVRLPTEAEWEKAASWEKSDKVTRWQGDKVKGRKRTYPWGDRFDKRKCNSEEAGIGGTTPVGAYSPAGDSPYGAADMAGNVWEWCADWYAADSYRTSPRTNPTGPVNGYGRVLRGGAYYTDQGRDCCCVRGYDLPSSRAAGSSTAACGCVRPPLLCPLIPLALWALKNDVYGIKQPARRSGGGVQRGRAPSGARLRVCAWRAILLLLLRFAVAVGTAGR